MKATPQILLSSVVIVDRLFRRLTPRPEINFSFDSSRIIRSTESGSGSNTKQVKFIEIKNEIGQNEVVLFGLNMNQVKTMLNNTKLSLYFTIIVSHEILLSHVVSTPR